MLYGKSPFNTAHDDQDQLSENILHKQLTYDPVLVSNGYANVDADTRDFLERLFQRDPKKRLGVPDDSQVLRHSFFRRFDLNKVKALQILPPFAPKCNSTKDLTLYFDDE